jgi:hypothetical protein
MYYSTGWLGKVGTVADKASDEHSDTPRHVQDELHNLSTEDIPSVNGDTSDLESSESDIDVNMPYISVSGRWAFEQLKRCDQLSLNPQPDCTPQLKHHICILWIACSTSSNKRYTGPSILQ